VRLEIVDRGRGISAHTLVGAGKLRSLGVGIAGMRERVRQLGGHLEIRSRGRGTSVKVSLPSGRRGVG
jgi:signal transduction histidine kinase